MIVMVPGLSSPYSLLYRRISVGQRQITLLIVASILSLELFVAVVHPTLTEPASTHPLEAFAVNTFNEEKIIELPDPPLNSKNTKDQWKGHEIDCESIHFVMATNIATNNVSKNSNNANAETTQKRKRSIVKHSNHSNSPLDSPHLHKPIWVPAYPGSGSELFRSLVTSLTGGLEGADWYLKKNGRCENYPATCKTHCPVLPGCQQDFGLYADNRKGVGLDLVRPNYYHHSAILLLRNPKKALPSYVNWIWERRKQKQQTTHQSQAPEWWWREYRDMRFMRMMNGWKAILTHWAETSPPNNNNNNKRRNKPPPARSPYNVTLILPYERLTKVEHGPRLLHLVTKELQQAQIPVTVPPSQYDCLWRRVVQAKDSKTKRTKLYEPGFTEEQQAKMLQIMNTLLRKFSVSSMNYRPDLVEMLTEYRDDIQNNLRIEEEEEVEEENEIQGGNETISEDNTL